MTELDGIQSRALELAEWFERYREVVPIINHNYVNLKTALNYLVDGDPFDLEILQEVNRQWQTWEELGRGGRHDPDGPQPNSNPGGRPDG